MSPDLVYILHKNGANSHYLALNYLLESNSKKLIYREFSIFTLFFKAIRDLNYSLLKKQVVNILFLISLLFTKNKKIVVGIAPFDYQLSFLLKLLKNHQVYYHTSWICWDKSYHPKRKNNSKEVFEKWKYFLEVKAKYIFCVTEASKKSLLENYQIDPNKINPVYHSLNTAFSSNSIASIRMDKSFIYVGRLVNQKGIEEALQFFAKNDRASLTLIGDGEKRQMVEKYAKEHKNIIFKDYITNKTELIEEFGKHQFLLLNSKKTERWEELFGMVIIESMSQGVIPVAANHPGPCEIISDETGVLFEEENMISTLEALIHQKSFDSDMSEKCIKASENYFPEKLAKNWSVILN